MKEKQKNKTTPEHIKELRKIRKEMAKEMKKDPKGFWDRIHAQGKAWRKEKSAKKAA